MKCQMLFTLLFVLMLISCDTNGDPMGDALLQAAEQGNIQAMQAALNGGADINYINPNFLSTEKTACAKAAEVGQMEALQWLVENGADWHKATSGNENPISLAAGSGHFSIVYYLIELGEDVNYQETNYGMTPFLAAARFGNVEAMQKLLELGANIYSRNKEMNDAVSIAIMGRQYQAVKFLLDKNMRVTRGFIKLAEYMNEFRPDENAIAIVDLLLEKGYDINEQDGGGHTALHIASMWGNRRLMDLLISKGADDRIQTNSGMSARNLFGYYLEQE